MVPSLNSEPELCKNHARLELMFPVEHSAQVTQETDRRISSSHAAWAT